MTEILTAAQMRAIEKAAIDSGEVTGLELMERAGAGVVAAIMEEWPDLALSSYKVVVLCGPGNNGGDGFVIARLLKGRGWEVEVFLYGDPEKLPPDAKVNYERWAEMGEVNRLSAASLQKKREAWVGGVIVDAVFGTGLTRPLPKDILEEWDCIFSWGFEPNYKVSVDIPTGVCADSGRVLSEMTPEARDENWKTPDVFDADLTVTFEAVKPGHFLAEGPQRCGKLRYVPLNIHQRTHRAKQKVLANLYDLPASGRGLGQHLLSLTDSENETYRIPKDVEDHKYTHGHALILSGLSGKTGAARLAARAALRVGSGLVTLGTPHEAVTEVAAQITALMLTEIDTPELLTRVLSDNRLNALCIGPAFGVERAGDFLPHVLAAKRATVLDADALTALAQSETAFTDLHEACVLTPHAGEFKRLFPDIAAKLAEPPTKGPAYSKVDATRDAAKRAGCTVLFKGPDTVIASPDGRCSINAAVYERAAPWLATAGSGDVLAGLITGLLARGFAPHHACETAAYLHVEAARSFGPGLIAEDLPEELPKVFRALGL